jgi:D-serine deaminase-like pyridoxal phosphate-dependent protein
MITTPTLLVDEQKCRNNIQKMATKAKRLGLGFRPHFKTHQSHQVGQWFRDAGITKITCSSFDMAAHFVEDSWEDIIVAFPVNVLEIGTINKLAARVNLGIVAESVEATDILSTQLAHDVDVYIKIDVGTHRTGMNPENTEAISAVINKIGSCNKMSFKGFLAHAGHSYGCRSEKEIFAVHQDCMLQLSKLKAHYPEALISYGDTPTCSVADVFEPVDELRPGNFCFYDLMQHQIGSCDEDEIAVAVACPVVAKHPERNEVVVYGGGVHFSKDFITEDGERTFGRVVEKTETGWGKILPEIKLDRVSQEHGIIKAPTHWIENFKIGDIVYVLPVHSCMTMDLLRDFKTI